MSSITSKPVLGFAILALIISAAALTEAFVAIQQLKEQTSRADAVSSQLSDVSTQLSSLAAKPKTGTRTLYIAIIPDMAGDGYDKFLPSTVTVLKGDTVKIVLNNTDDMDHGFNIDAYGIGKIIHGEETLTIEFVADQAGVFEFYCSVFCGPGHSQMTGQLIVLS